MTKTLLAVALLCSAAHLAQADFSGKVVSISDGDTVTVLNGTEQVKVRLDGIDCPETGQPWGTKAKQATANVCFGKVVTVIEKDTDRYGRTIGVIERDGENVNLALVQEGYAWWYRKYAASNKDLAAAEKSARDAKRGLWQDARPIPPWDWRSGDREPETEMSDEPGELTHWINADSDKRHRKSCRYFGKGNGRPCTAEEGIPCKICGG